MRSGYDDPHRISVCPKDDLVSEAGIRYANVWVASRAAFALSYFPNSVKVAKLMAADELYEGYAIVLKEGKPAGMVTERDLVKKVLAKDLDPSKTKVAEIMSTPLVTVHPDDDLLKASTLMQAHKVRKLVVVDDEIIYGIITAKDIARRCGEYVNKSVRDAIRWTAPIYT